MLQHFTLVIPSHNRHQYLDRILEYYAEAGLDIVVVDSTKEKYIPKKDKPAFTYLHYPQYSLPQKLAAVLEQINTKYTALLADDDFIIPEAIPVCMDFLEAKPDHVAVQGNALVFQKAHLRKRGQVDYKALYPNLFTFENDSEKWDERVMKLFNPYRSILWAVHRTEYLRKAYSLKVNVVSNLFFSEYLSGIIPVALGKVADINILYQVRENAEVSDDKTTPNIDLLMDNPAKRDEVNSYIDYISSALQPSLQVPKEEIALVVERALRSYAATKPSVAQNPKSIKKQIGSMISVVPVLGKQLVERNRKMETAQQLKRIIKTKEEAAQLERITSVIKKYEL